MTCPDCTRSATELWHVFNANCRGCHARLFSRTKEFDRVRRVGKLDAAYQRALDISNMTHKEARAAWDLDAINKDMKNAKP